MGGFLPFAGTNLGDKVAPRAVVSAFLNPHSAKSRDKSVINYRVLSVLDV
jgi:hypothetical protein